jgi:hypothetical protein
MPIEITPTEIDRRKSVVPTQLEKSRSWAFSFKYFNQIEYFGLDRCEPKWFSSLLFRLRELCQKNLSEIFSDKNMKNFYRYHKIDWGSKNIPIQKSDLNWVDKVYLENDDDFPFHQFQVSKAKGRVIGFWNEDHSVFYITLLDPLHNIQPSKSFDYKVDDCYPLSCEFSSLHNDIHNLSRQKTNCEDCNIRGALSTIPTKLNSSSAIVGFLDEGFLKEFDKISKTKSLTEILEAGIISLMN